MKNINGCYVNIDSDMLGYIWHGVKGDMSDLTDKLDLYIEGHKGHGITDLLFNIFCQNSIVPSKFVECRKDKFYEKEQHGTPVDYTKETAVVSLVDTFANHPDPVKYLMDKSKAEGFNTWLSYRMNDCHWSGAETSPGRSENLYYYAKENGKFVGENVIPKYFAECLDYSDAHIREVMLNYIRETVERYDPYGIELDFLREPFCFDYEKTPDASQIMNGFIREVKAIAIEFGKKFGHEIKILARLVRDIENNKIFGLDAATWIKEGLVDVIVPTSRWNDTDSDMPIGEWVRLAEGTKTEISAGLEFYLWGQIKVNGDTARGLCAQYLDEGSGKIYLYNFYREAVLLPDMTEWYKTHPNFKIDEKRYDAIGDKNIWDCDKMLTLDFAKPAIWEACSDLDNIYGKTRRHVLTFTEDCLVPKGGNAFNPLPIRVNGEESFSKLTGKVKGEKVLLYLGITKDAKPPRVTVDGKEATLIGKTEDAYFQNPEKDGPNPSYFGSFDYYAYEVTAGEGNYRDISFFSDSVAVEYLEFKVN